MKEPLSLYELNSRVRQTLEEGLAGTYWLQAELSEVRVNASRHCYVEFVQKAPKGNVLLAKARGTIWSNVFQLLKPYFEEETGQPFVAGIKVLVEVVAGFHELYGYSLTVLDIDPAYTLGDLALRRREILKQLEEEGVLTLNKELPMPMLPQRVAIITSSPAFTASSRRLSTRKRPSQAAVSSILPSLTSLRSMWSLRHRASSRSAASFSWTMPGSISQT